jgi:hypothetical protein
MNKNIKGLASRLSEQLAATMQREAKLNTEIVRLRTVLNQIAWPSHFGAEDPDPRGIARKGLIIRDHASEYHDAAERKP